MTKLLVFGPAGRMGGKILELASQDKDFDIVGAVESHDHRTLGMKILDGKVAISSDLSAFKKAAPVVIDFTSPQATLAHLGILSSWDRAAAVIGTTGFTDKEKDQIKRFAADMPIVMSPNMSRGVNLLLKLVRDAARKLGDYDIEIIEAHHNQKKDAPSGTALGLAAEIADELKRNPKTDYVYGREGNTGARTKKEIGIHAVRAGDIVGDHTVIFATGGERLELKHIATSRDAFAAGALHAAKWVSAQKPGLYTMQDVLKG